MNMPCLLTYEMNALTKVWLQVMERLLETNLMLSLESWEF